ncbi:hypothetical protein J4426_03480 [Candidatus Woesearchaeota archaeon]|nr:hypothetical protein [Candidatus Woesearchaeota archaeon]
MVKIISSFFVFLLLVSFVSAISDEERSLIEEGLSKYADDPEKLDAFLQVVDETYDLSGENALREEVISSSKNYGLNESIENVLEGKAPPPKESTIESEELSLEETVNEEEDNKGFGWVAVIIIAVIISIAGIFYFFRRRGE